jgi:hypothetical protein
MVLHARPDLAYGQGPSQALFHLCGRLWHTMGHVESDDPRQQHGVTPWWCCALAFGVIRHKFKRQYEKRNCRHVQKWVVFSVDFDTVVHDFCFAVVDDCWIDTCPYMSSIHHPLIWQCACGQSISSESGVLGGASSGLTFVTRSAPEVWGTQNLCCWILWVKTLVHRYLHQNNLADVCPWSDGY